MLNLVTQTVRIHLQYRRPQFDPWVRKIPWRKWLSTPVFLPGEFYGQRSLAGYSPWGHKESDMTEQLTLCLKISVRQVQYKFLTHCYIFLQLEAI